MNIDHHFTNDILVISIPDGNGRLISSDIDVFINNIFKLSKTDAGRIALNMSKKSFLNSSGLGELIKVKDRLLDKNIELVLIKPSERVKSLINMVGVDQFFKIIDSEDKLA